MSLVSGFAVQTQVINALLLRETRTRFGQYQLGYFWAFIEPLAWVLMFYILFNLRGRGAPFGMDVFPFILTGMMPYIMFRNAFRKSMQGINSNKPLLYFPQIRPLDFALTRTILEGAIMTSVFVILMGAYWLHTESIDIDNYLYVIFGMVLAMTLGFSVGLFFMAVIVFYPSARMVVSVTLRPLLWFSGIFYTANELPTSVRELFLWNPVLHIVEMVRGGWFKEYQPYYLDLPYVVTWILVLGYLGLFFERAARRRLELE